MGCSAMNNNNDNNNNNNNNDNNKIADSEACYILHVGEYNCNQPIHAIGHRKKDHCERGTDDTHAL